jgi:SAM-dependent methyltransferase
LVALSWRFDELGHAGGEHLDAGYVAAFDEKAGTDWSEEVATLVGHGVGKMSTVIDIGAGTGTFAQAIARRVKRVVAVDVSPAMVAIARARGLEAVERGSWAMSIETGWSMRYLVAMRCITFRISGRRWRWLESRACCAGWRAAAA